MIIGVLKSLGFLDDGGKPTDRYYQYLDQSQSGQILAEGIREAYQDLFKVNKDAHKLSNQEIINKLRTLSQGKLSDAVLKKFAMTFTALVKQADFLTPAKSNAEDRQELETGNNGGGPAHESAGLQLGGLHYNIQLILPDTRDPKVFDALFPKFERTSLVTSSEAYSFVFRGLLTEEALDKAGRISSYSQRTKFSEIRSLLGIDVVDEQHVVAADRMSQVYVVVAAFENSVRELVSGVLLEAHGDDWWNKCVKAEIRNDANQRMESEDKVRWHVNRGSDPLNFVMIGDLLSIILKNFDDFEPFLHDRDWAKNVFDTIERSRNVIMHAGNLSNRDMARIGSIVKDWNSQVAL